MSKYAKYELAHYLGSPAYLMIERFLAWKMKYDVE